MNSHLRSAFIPLYSSFILLLFSVDKWNVATGTYIFVSVILNSNPVDAIIAGGSLLIPASLTVILAKT